MNRIAQLTPGRSLSTPGLQLGLLLAAAFIVAAIHYSDYRAVK